MNNISENENDLKSQISYLDVKYSGELLEIESDEFKDVCVNELKFNNLKYLKLVNSTNNGTEVINNLQILFKKVNNIERIEFQWFKLKELNEILQEVGNLTHLTGLSISNCEFESKKNSYRAM